MKKLVLSGIGRIFSFKFKSASRVGRGPEGTSGSESSSPSGRCIDSVSLYPSSVLVFVRRPVSTSSPPILYFSGSSSSSSRRNAGSSWLPWLPATPFSLWKGGLLKSFKKLNLSFVPRPRQ